MSDDPKSYARSISPNVAPNTAANTGSFSDTLKSSSGGLLPTLSAMLKDYMPEADKAKPLSHLSPDAIRAAFDQMTADIRNGNNLTTETRELAPILAYLSSGRGGYVNQMQTFFSALDQFNAPFLPPNMENSGYIFFTRPRLCLRTPNLRSARTMVPLDTLNNTSVAFAIRTLLDTNLLNDNNGPLFRAITSSPLVDYQNPFLVPLCNSCTGLNGAPDIAMQHAVTEGGVMGEAEAFAIGSDNLMRGGYALTLSFRDAQDGPVAALFYYWLEYIRCVTRGIMLAYPDDIDEQIINYTISIYRFLLDPSRTYITKWAKFTGCFPTSLPLGNMFNMSAGTPYDTASSNLTINFICNRVEYMDYAILMDFNTLMRRYCSTINKTISNTEHEPLFNGQPAGFLKHPNLIKTPINNFRGLPYITSDMRGAKLVFRQVPNPASTKEIDELVLKLTTAELRDIIMKDATVAAKLETEYPSMYTDAMMSSKTPKDVIHQMVANTLPKPPPAPPADGEAAGETVSAEKITIKPTPEVTPPAGQTGSSDGWVRVDDTINRNTKPF